MYNSYSGVFIHLDILKDIKSYVARYLYRNAISYEVILILYLDDSAGTLSDEKRLTRHLLKTYEMAGVLGRPVYNTSSVLVVQFGISLIQIIDLDEKGQVLTLNVWNNYVSLMSSNF